MQAREISKAIYTEFLQRHSLDNVWQTTMMGDMQEARGRHVLYLGIFDDTDTLTGATNVVLESSHFGALHAGSPRGPILDYTGSQVTASLQAVRDFLKQKHVMYWTLNPYAVYENTPWMAKPSRDPAVRACTTSSWPQAPVTGDSCMVSTTPQNPGGCM